MNSVFEVVVKASSPTRNQIGYTPPPLKGGGVTTVTETQKEMGVWGYRHSHSITRRSQRVATPSAKEQLAGGVAPRLQK